MGCARTVCELLRWRRPNGRLKARECREFLERLDAEGALVPPEKRQGRAVGSVTRVPRTGAREPGRRLLGSVADVEPLDVELVREPAQRLLFRELVGRYHYLGHTVPFGAQLRYLVFASRPQRAVVGCLQFSSPAWRMAVRDRWVGWDDRTRARNLQHVVNNSRFLLPPWLAVRNLASAVLSRGLSQLAVDWPRHYHLEPWLVETLVDSRADLRRAHARQAARHDPASTYRHPPMTTTCDPLASHPSPARPSSTIHCEPSVHRRHAAAYLPRLPGPNPFPTSARFPALDTRGMLSIVSAADSCSPNPGTAHHRTPQPYAPHAHRPLATGPHNQPRGHPAPLHRRDLLLQRRCIHPRSGAQCH